MASMRFRNWETPMAAMRHLRFGLTFFRPKKKRKMSPTWGEMAPKSSPKASFGPILEAFFFRPIFGGEKGTLSKTFLASFWGLFGMLSLKSRSWACFWVPRRRVRFSEAFWSVPGLKLHEKVTQKTTRKHTFSQNGKRRLDMVFTVREPHGVAQGGCPKPSKKQACKKGVKKRSGGRFWTPFWEPFGTTSATCSHF